jgi:hypothetical protein
VPGTPYPLGPFTAGMNNISEEATVEDTQVTLARNLELDFDGSYRSRPAVVLDAASPVAGENLTQLGYYVTVTNQTFLVCTTDAKTWLYDILAKTFTEIWASKASGFAQFDNKVVLISEAVAGGYWEAGLWTSTPTMPLAADIVLYQSRFWAYGARGASNQNRIWFSNITSAGSTPTSIWTWTTASDYIDVEKGDGEWITHIRSDPNSLLIFRNRSTWRLTYPTTPFKGELRELNSVIGAENRHCVVPYENYYLVFSQGRFYQFIQYAHYPLSDKRINFEGAATSSPVLAGREIMMSIFGSRCLVWYYGATYAYDIITNTWSTWESPTTYAGHFLQIPQTSLLGTARTALAVTGVNAASMRGVYRVVDDVLPAGQPGEDINCVLRTKSYAFDESAQYKRMFYWTFEVRSADGATGVAFPSAIPTELVTYDDMDLVTYDVLDGGNYDNPLIILPEYETDVSFPAASPVRALIKAGQDSRLMRMYYQVSLSCDGTARTAPVRIYSITPYVRIKGGVSKQVT